MRVLNREVRVILEGVDKHDNLIGRLMYVGSGEELVDLGTQLVSAGLAKVPFIWAAALWRSSFVAETASLIVKFY